VARIERPNHSEVNLTYTSPGLYGFVMFWADL
jgi:hypothetical protein